MAARAKQMTNVAYLGSNSGQIIVLAWGWSNRTQTASARRFSCETTQTIIKFSMFSQLAIDFGIIIAYKLEGMVVNRDSHPFLGYFAPIKSRWWRAENLFH